MKRISFLILLFLSNQLFAQTQNEFWSKIYFSKKLSDRWTLGIDGQYRRQADYFSNDKNIFHYSLAKSMRVWTFYELKNNWKLIASPLAFFNNENLKNSSGTAGQSNDLRSMIGAGKTYYSGNIVNNERLLYEADLLGINTGNQTLRKRYRLLTSTLFPLKHIVRSSSLNYYFFNEIFYKTQGGNSSFDQNHLYNGIQWKIKESDINAGYQYTYQKGFGKYLNKNQLYVFVNIAL